jgi:hypothetical protein
MEGTTIATKIASTHQAFGTLLGSSIGKPPYTDEQFNSEWAENEEV